MPFFESMNTSSSSSSSSSSEPNYSSSHVLTTPANHSENEILSLINTISATSSPPLPSLTHMTSDMNESKSSISPLSPLTSDETVSDFRTGTCIGMKNCLLMRRMEVWILQFLWHLKKTYEEKRRKRLILYEQRRWKEIKALAELKLSQSKDDNNMTVPSKQEQTNEQINIKTFDHTQAINRQQYNEHSSIDIKSVAFDCKSTDQQLSDDKQICSLSQSPDDDNSSLCDILDFLVHTRKPIYRPNCKQQLAVRYHKLRKTDEQAIQDHFSQLSVLQSHQHVLHDDIVQTFHRLPADDDHDQESVINRPFPYQTCPAHQAQLEMHKFTHPLHELEHELYFCKDSYTCYFDDPTKLNASNAQISEINQNQSTHNQAYHSFMTSSLNLKCKQLQQQYCWCDYSSTLIAKTVSSEKRNVGNSAQISNAIKDTSVKEEKKIKKMQTDSEYSELELGSRKKSKRKRDKRCNCKYKKYPANAQALGMICCITEAFLLFNSRFIHTFNLKEYQRAV
jgi:hypothetical protein